MHDLEILDASRFDAYLKTALWLWVWTNISLSVLVLAPRRRP
jgi:hypothetical protein